MKVCFSHRFILHQNDDFLNGLVNVEAHSLGIGFLYECSNARDHLTGPIAVAENAAHGVPRFIEIWGRCGKPAQRGIGVCDDVGERLVLSQRSLLLTRIKGVSFSCAAMSGFVGPEL